MRAGKMDRRLRIEQGGTAIDSTHGDEAPSWTLVATVWAQREDLQGSELFRAQQVNSRISTRFTIRHRTGLTGKMRVLEGGTYYDVESVTEGEVRRETTVLLCSRSGN